MHEPDASPSALAPGAVAFSRGAKFVVLARLDDRRAEALPIAPVGHPITRAEVVLDYDALSAMGFLGRMSIGGQWVVRVDSPTRITGGIKVGETPPEVMAEIRRSISHLAQTQQIEQRYKRPAKRK